MSQQNYRNVLGKKTGLSCYYIYLQA